VGCLNAQRVTSLFAFHLLDGDLLRRPVAQAGIGISHRKPFLPEKPDKPRTGAAADQASPAEEAQTIPRRELSRPFDVCLSSEISA